MGKEKSVVPSLSLAGQLLVGTWYRNSDPELKESTLFLLLHGQKFRSIEYVPIFISCEVLLGVSTVLLESENGFVFCVCVCLCLCGYVFLMTAMPVTPTKQPGRLVVFLVGNSVYRHH